MRGVPDAGAGGPGNERADMVIGLMLLFIFLSGAFLAVGAMSLVAHWRERRAIRARVRWRR